MRILIVLKATGKENARAQFMVAGKSFRLNDISFKEIERIRKN
jgi:hypothetical protein